MPQPSTPPQIQPNTTQQEPQRKHYSILTQTPPTPTQIDTTPLPKPNLNPITPNQLPHLIRPRPPPKPTPTPYRHPT